MEWIWTLGKVAVIWTVAACFLAPLIGQFIRTGNPEDERPGTSND